MTAVVGAKDRATGRVAATVSGSVGAATRQTLATDGVGAETMVFTDEQRSHETLSRDQTGGIRRPESVHLQPSVEVAASDRGGIERCRPDTLQRSGRIDRCDRKSLGSHSRLVPSPRSADPDRRDLIGERLQYTELVAA